MKPLHEQFAALAREHGVEPVRIQIDTADGSKIIHRLSAKPALEPAWKFAESTATYRGRSFRCKGKPFKLLQALAGAVGQDVPNPELKAAVWGARHAAEDGQLRNLVCQLRNLLLAELGAGHECVVASGDGAHRLTLI